METSSNKSSPHDRLALIVSCLIAAVCVVDLVRYLLLGNQTATLTVLVVGILITLCAFGAYMGRVYLAYGLITAAAIALFVFTNHAGTAMFNVTLGVTAFVSAIGFLYGLWLIVKKEGTAPRKAAVPFFACIAVILLAFATVWGIKTRTDKVKTEAESCLWAVPTVFDSQESTKPGTLEKLDYTTRAYATDSREVTKTAWVYLPYGYNEETSYNILYLMHGTGDDEEYWLKTFSYNRTMVDNLIEKGVIDPLIIVTPTFYVENDCADNLDALTYSFREELRNDLMPLVEGKYSTFVSRTDEKSFQDSREHRAFAGLSRGAVTTLHSAFCGSLDYYAWFGTFSASRTPLSYYQEKNMTQETKDLPIRYWYVASGNFDFGLVSQLQDYAAITEADPRLKKGENTTLEVYLMRYHSMGNWHLALYNLLLRIF